MQIGKLPELATELGKSEIYFYKMQNTHNKNNSKLKGKRGKGADAKTMKFVRSKIGPRKAYNLPVTVNFTKPAS